MAKLPDVENLGERPTPQPASGTVGYSVPNGIEAPGQALAQAGSIVAAMGAHWQEKQDTTRVEDAWNKYKNAALDATVGQNGVLNKKGGDAVNGNILQATGNTLAEARQAIESTLTSDDQRRRFSERATVTDLQVKHQVLAHLAGAQQEYAKTTMMGSEAAAKSQITAVPTSPDVFKQAKDQLMMQADAYLDSQGVRDPLARTAYKEKVTDGLWKTRIDALLYDKPKLADALYRANSAEIKNPELRLQLQAQTREASIGVNGSLIAQKALDETRAAIKPSQSAERTSPEAGPAPEGQMTDTGVAVNPGARSTRNNNPGNIEKSSTKWQGEVQGDDSRFVKFATYEDGVRAMQQNLLAYQDKRGINTVEGIIGRWAPAKENGEAATTNYVKKVASALGVKPGDKIDLHDPETMQTVVKAMTAYEAGGSGSGAQRAGTPNTNGMPNATDVAAQLPIVLAKAEKLVNEEYGVDPLNPDRAYALKRVTAEVHAKLSEDVKQLNAIQHQARAQLVNAIAGISETGTPGAGGATKTAATGAQGQKITSYGQIQADPVLYRQYLMLDYPGQQAVDNLISKNMKAEDKGDAALYRQIFDDIQRDDSDPKKIVFNQQITRYPGSDRLSVDQMSKLFGFAASATSPGGRSFNQLRAAATKDVEDRFKIDLNSNMAFLLEKTTNPTLYKNWTMAWNEAVGKKIDEFVAAGQLDKIRPLFMPGTPGNVVDPAYLSTFMGKGTTTPQALATMASAAKAGTAQPIAQPPAQPKTEAEYNALPPGTVYLDPTGKQRQKPGQTPSAAGTPPLVATEAQARSPEQVPPVLQIVPPQPTMNDQGKIVDPAPPAAAAPITADDFQLVDKPTTVAGNIAAIRTAREKALKLRKEGAIGPQYDVTGPIESVAAGFATAEDRARALVSGAAYAVGGAIAQKIPTELEAVTAGFEAIKKNRKVTAADADILEQVLKYGLLPPDDEKLARGLLARLQGKK